MVYFRRQDTVSAPDENTSRGLQGEAHQFEANRKIPDNFFADTIGFVLNRCLVHQ